MASFLGLTQSKTSNYRRASGGTTEIKIVYFSHACISPLMLVDFNIEMCNDCLMLLFYFDRHAFIKFPPVITHSFQPKNFSMKTPGPRMHVFKSATPIAWVSGTVQTWTNATSIPGTQQSQSTVIPSLAFQTPAWTTVILAALVLTLLSILILLFRCTKPNTPKITCETAGKCSKNTFQSCSSTLSYRCDASRTLIPQTQTNQTILSQENQTKCQKQFHSLKHKRNQQNNFLEQTSVDTILTSKGLVFYCGQYKLEFPPNVVSKSERIRVTLQPSSELELDGSKLFPIAPILRCEPSGLKFKKNYKVTLQSSFSSQLKSDLAKVHILVRQSVENPFQGESVTRLGCDGHTTFYANHFSDREPTVDSRDFSIVRKTLRTFGFVKKLNEVSREITWYLLDIYDQSFEQIKSLHSKEDVSVPLYAFAVDANQSLRLKLSAAANEVQFNRNQIVIASEVMRNLSAKSYKFLLTRSKHPNRSSSIILYAISKFVAQAAEHENIESLVTTEGDFFSIAWDANLDSQTSIYVGDQVSNHYYNQSSASTSNTFPRCSREATEATVENGLAMQSKLSRRETPQGSSFNDFSTSNEYIVTLPASRVFINRTASSFGASSNQSQELGSFSSINTFSPTLNSTAAVFPALTQEEAEEEQSQFLQRRFSEESSCSGQNTRCSVAEIVQRFESMLNLA